jgi:glyoxylase-like metal-dependent hydrolase (beta-lactamase superfamily II)
MVEPEKIAEGVFRIAPGRSNCYLLAGTDLTLIDTGMPGEAETIKAAITALGLKPEKIGHILITHGHLDHTGSLAELKKISGAQVIAGTKDAAYIQGSRKTWTMGREGFGGKIFKAVLFYMETFVFKYQPATVDMPCQGGETINCSGGIQVIATPGHSPGSLSFYHKDKKLLFVGDALSGADGFHLPQRFGCASYADALRSVENLTNLDFDTCLPGHGAPVVGTARQQMARLIEAQQAKA